jgi:hypothetical protein
MDTQPFEATPSRNKWSHALFSPTLLIYYGVLVAAMTTVWWFVK